MAGWPRQVITREGYSGLTITSRHQTAASPAPSSPARQVVGGLATPPVLPHLLTLSTLLTPHSTLLSFHSLCEAPQHCLFLQWSVCIWSLLALPEDPMSSPDVSVVQSVEPVSVIKTKAFRPSPHHHIECRQSEVWSLKSEVWSLDLGPWNAGAEPDCPGGGVGHRTPCDPLTTLSWGVTGNTGRVT